MFEVAQSQLDAASDVRGRRYRTWTDKVELASNGFTLHYPDIDAQVFAEITQALFHERKLKIIYRPRSEAGREKENLVSPLGLVEIDNLVYLVASVEHHENPAIYRLDRFSAAVMQPDVFTYPASFRLADYVKHERQFDFMPEGEVHLQLRFFNGAGDHLLEAPLSLDQRARRNGEVLEVEGSIRSSQRLRWWLRAFGSNVEVVRPAKLREEFAREAEVLSALYLGQGN